MKILGIFFKFPFCLLLVLVFFISLTRAFGPPARFIYAEALFKLLHGGGDVERRNEVSRSSSSTNGAVTTDLHTTLKSLKSPSPITSENHDSLDNSSEDISYTTVYIPVSFPISSKDRNPSEQSESDFIDITVWEILSPPAPTSSSSDSSSLDDSAHSNSNSDLSNMPSDSASSTTSVPAMMIKILSGTNSRETLTIARKQHYPLVTPAEHQQLGLGYIIWPSLLGAVLVVVMCASCCHLCRSTAPYSSSTSNPRRASPCRRRIHRAPNSRRRGVQFSPTPPPSTAAPLSRYTSRASNALGRGDGGGGGGGNVVIGRSSLRDEDIPMLVPIDPREFWLTREESRSRGTMGMGRLGVWMELGRRRGRRGRSSLFYGFNDYTQDG